MFSDGSMSVASAVGLSLLCRGQFIAIFSHKHQKLICRLQDRFTHVGVDTMPAAFHIEVSVPQLLDQELQATCVILHACKSAVMCSKHCLQNATHLHTGMDMAMMYETHAGQQMTMSAAVHVVQA